MKISIPNPCSEDWSKMTPTEQGAFCKKCALEVTDFTKKSPLEIKEILTAKIQSKQRVCGNIENRQLIEFNQEFIPWKSDQESFRAIWAFSLIAVFGFTLFSCQSTFSKEVVEKMKTSTEQMLEEEKDTLDLAKLNDSLEVMNSPDTLPLFAVDAWDRNEPYKWMGTIALNERISSNLDTFNINICHVFFGDFIVSGNILPEEKLESDGANLVEPFNPFHSRGATPTFGFGLESHQPSPKKPNQNNNQRLNAKLEKGRPDFKAHITPIPIDKTSQLHVTIPAEGELKLSIWELPSITNMHSERFDMVFGNHAIDINFHEFPNGKYAVQLIWEDEKVVVPFEIPPQKVS